MTGVLLVDKPAGVTSAGVIRRLGRRLGRRTKVGHVGTLDPFASGLLPLCVGEATKVARYLTGSFKTYEGTIVLGVATDTLDPTGAVVDEAGVPPLDAGLLATVADAFTGTMEQTPPMYSAVKRAGVPLHRLARRGEEVERAPRVVTVRTLTLRIEGPGRIGLHVECSKGTYVRVLASDVGRALGTVAHLGSLRRLTVGALSVEQAAGLAELEDAAHGVPLPLVPVADALGHLCRHVVSGPDLGRLRQGQQEPLERLPPGDPGDPLLLLEGDAEGPVCGVAEAGPTGRWRLVRLLHPDSGTEPLHG